MDLRITSNNANALNANGQGPKHMMPGSGPSPTFSNSNRPLTAGADGVHTAGVISARPSHSHRPSYEKFFNS